MPRFGKRSKERLKGVDRRLVSVLNELIKIIIRNIIIFELIRIIIKQEIYNNKNLAERFKSMKNNNIIREQKIAMWKKYMSEREQKQRLTYQG